MASDKKSAKRNGGMAGKGTRIIRHANRPTPKEKVLSHGAHMPLGIWLRKLNNLGHAGENSNVTSQTSK